MNTTTLTEVPQLTGLGIDALREIAKGKIKSYSKFNKAALLQELTNYFVAAEIAAIAAAEAAKPAKPAKAPKAPKAKKAPKAEAPSAPAEAAAVAPKNRCEICKVRPQMSSAEKAERGNFPFCSEDLTLAYMENEHSDNAHTEIAAYEASDKGKGTSAPLSDAAAMQAEFEIMAKCWVCHPELDETLKEYVKRSGTSRAGIQMATPVRTDGQTKAEVVAAKLEAVKAAAKITASKSIVKLSVKVGETEIVLAWETTGRTRYDLFVVTVAGKARKIRNVSDALRMLGAKK